MSIARALFIGLTFIPFLTSCDSLQRVARTGVDQSQTLQLMQGQWVHDADSFASLTIHHRQWTFTYKGEASGPGDSYEIALTKHLPGYINETERATCLILSNNTDTLAYEIVGLTDSTFSVMYFPSGKMYLYRRQR